VLVRALAEPPLRDDPGRRARRRRPVARRAPPPARAARARRAPGVASRLFDVGFRDDVNNVYGAADVVVVPSKQPDPLPNAPGGRGRGVLRLASDHGGLPEILRDRETGRLVRPGDPGAWPRDRRACRGAGRARAAGCRRLPGRRTALRDRRMLSEIQSLYDRLLA